MKTKKICLTLLLAAMMCVPASLSAQVTIGSGNPPSEWSLLDLQATEENRKALHLPRLTYNERNDLMSDAESDEDQRDARGLMIFNTCDRCLEYWNGKRWVSLCFGISGDAGVISQPDPLSVNIGDGQTFAFVLGEASINDAAGNFAYQWQYSTDGGSTWHNAPGVSNQQNYTTIALNRSTLFRRLATLNGVTDITEPALVRVWKNSNAAAPGTLETAPYMVTHHYQWNRRQEWAVASSNMGWNSTGEPGTAWESENDPCPDGWRVPTAYELASLLAGAVWTIGWQGTNVQGMVHGVYPNQIFLPRSGFRVNNGGAMNTTDVLFYWSSTPHETNEAQALRLFWFPGDASGEIQNGNRATGHTIRCVSAF